MCSWEELRLPLFEKKKSYFDQTWGIWGICCFYIFEVCMTGFTCFHIRPAMFHADLSSRVTLHILRTKRFSL